MLPLLVAGRRVNTSGRVLRSNLSKRSLHQSSWAERIDKSSRQGLLKYRYESRSYFVPLLDSAFRSYEHTLFHKPTYAESAPVRASMLAGSPFVGTVGKPRPLHRAVDWIKRLLQKYWDYVLVFMRGTEIAFILSPLMLLTPAAVFADQFLHTSAVSDMSWAYLLSAVQFFGPVFVKLSQWAATRRDIFPPHMCDRLSKLQADGLPHSWVHTDLSLRDAFGDYEAKGLSVKPHDIVGCGSAAQVYAGTLATTNQRGEKVERKVAIKILHPDFHEMIDRDIWFLQSIANAINALPFKSVKVMNMPGATSTFAGVLEKQADLRIEADNLKRFRENFYKKHEEKRSAIFFPSPMEGWVTPNVLIEDLVSDGVPIAEYVRDDSVEGRRIRKELAGPLLRAFLKMVFIDNWVHGDIHPGNVLIRTTLEKKENNILVKLFHSLFGDSSSHETEGQIIKRTIVFLDAGIATELGENDRKNLFDLFKAVITNNGAEAGRLMVERAKHERCSQMEGGVEAFATGIGEIVSEFHDRRKNGLTLGAVRIGSLLSRVLDLCRVYGVEVDPAMANVVISTLVLEGLGRSLDEQMNLIDFAVPFVLGGGRV
ncbi:hypothetical protein MPSEU_000501900 [Mayamaea pseudoterrestris]|nr:hypothetical protein MPSEU_000501900 [Mayamaea pseudoterrestris]